MARLVPDFEFRGRGRPQKYPWEEWADGQKRILTRGEDFTTTVESMRSRVYGYADTNNLRVISSVINEKELAVQFFAR